MKVIHLISGGDSGGARTHVHLLLKHLTKDMDITLVCFMDGPFAQEARELGIPTVIINKSFPATLKELKKLIKDGGYDIIHCHGSRGNLVGALLKHTCGVPVITTVHSDPKIDYLGRPLARLTYGTLNAIALRCMDYHIGVSDAMRDLLMSRGFNSERIFAIYNGVEFDDAEPKSHSARRAYLASLGLDWTDENLVVGIAARFHPVKDIPTLLRGFALAYADHPELRLLIAGDGQDRAALEELSRELGIEKVTCFAGWQSEVDSFYRALDINTLTSLSETFPYALTEGARAHLPTVASRVGGVPLLIRDRENGLLFEAGDHEALGAHLSELASSPALREELAQALFLRASTEFSAAATAERQKAIYSLVLKNSAKRKAKTREGVVICGAYGMVNAGDEAILEAIIAEMRSISHDMPITVMTRQPQETAKKFGVRALFTFDVFSWLRAMRRARVYINGGGSLIQDVTSTRSLWYYLFTIAAAKAVGCRVMMYGCGIGPVNRGGNKRLVRRVLNKHVDIITLREPSSAAELEVFGVNRPKIILAADPVFSLPTFGDKSVSETVDGFGVKDGGKYIGFCLRKWRGFAEKAELFAKAAEYAREKYGCTPVFIPINYPGDSQAAAETISKMPGEAITLRTAMTNNVAAEVMRRMSVVVSMRLHGLIFAVSQSVPIVGVSYDPKVTAFLEYIEQDNFVELEDVTEEKLCAMIDRAAAVNPEQLHLASERLRKIENRNTEAARSLYEEG